MHLDKLIEFVATLNKYKKNKIIKCYLDLYGVNLNELNSRCNYNKLALLILFAPKILEVVIKCSKTKKSKIDFLSMYSLEQKKYIRHPILSDLKLVACAGSGKTRSIIGRIKFLTTHNIVKKEHVYMITFSKAASVDFCDKIKKLFPKYEKFCVLKNFSTIDSLAKAILCRVKSHKSENVEILSIAFRNFLKNATNADIALIKITKDIRHIFIDEAQDLNEIQFDILMLLKQRFNTSIEIIGDPNQNIYQFRRSSSSYLINYPCDSYELTLNFRSTNQIIAFSESLKPVATSKSISATNKNGPKVTIWTKSTSEIHNILLKFLSLYNKDLSNIAIVCPTRGIGNFDNVGLSLIFNLLKTNKIPFNQLYNETGSYSEGGKNSAKIPGHVNIMTYHGTKGLEFDVVFVMDFYQHLFNIQPTEDEHHINQYLLYVASSRAINMMFVCTYTNVHGGYLNYWIKQVNRDSYVIEKSLRLPKLAYRSKSQNRINAITELLAELSDEDLNTIDDMIKVQEGINCFSESIYDDCSDIDRGKDETLFGIFCEELFYLQYSLINNQIPRNLHLIQMIIESKFVIIQNDYDFNLLRIYIVSNKLSWKMYDAMIDNIPKHVQQLVEKYFNRNVPLNDCVVCTNEFIRIIDANIDDIIKTYAKYKNPLNYENKYENIITDFFYLIVVQYAYDNNHYFYIGGHGCDKQYLLKNGKKLFKNINRYIKNNYKYSTIAPKHNVYYKKLGIVGEIDFIEKRQNNDSIVESIVEIKCTKEISIKYYLQMILYNFCLYSSFPKLIYKNNYKLINLLTGIEYNLRLKISKHNMFLILNMFSKIGNLEFMNLHLVYDLETTGQIKMFTSNNKIKLQPRINSYRKNNIYINEIYPEITEIAIKDYDTEMIVLSTLVKPTSKISSEISTITGITNKMVKKQPLIGEIVKILERATNNFRDCKMLAHNGNRFDNKILLHYKMINPKNISFIDTMSIIPIHLEGNTKLVKKSLGHIYYFLFKKNFKAHRAMNDVDALIRIMKYLKIHF